MLTIKEIFQKELWEGFLLDCEEKTFLDSWNWGEFHKMMGERIWRFGIFKDDRDPISVALVIKVSARRGSFLFVPHYLKSDNTDFLLEKLKELAKRENCSFIRIAPAWPRNEENEKIFRDLGFRQAPIHMHPEVTWELNIRPSEQELLAKMRKTTRYLIRQVEKNPDIEIIQSQNIEDIEKFNQLYQATVDRHHFVSFSLNYLKNEFLAFLPDGQISIFLGKYKDEIISSAVIIFWQGIGFYHQGASSQKYAKIPVSYLLQWQAIKEAKKRGCQLYNFWGISDIKNKKHPWYGLSLFKMGFGGYKKEYLKTQDFVLSPKYWLNYLIETIRRKKRGL